MVRLVVALLLLLVCTGVFAANDSYAQGVAAYNAHRYKDAVKFLTEAASASRDPAVHYYLGLSYQGMNQVSLARQQYQWVAQQTSNPVFAAQAKTALRQLNMYMAASLPATQSKAGLGANGSSVAFNGVKFVGRPQIVEFYADW
jgi:tetratricopeptide (TPR) repeat protein